MKTLVAILTVGIFLTGCSTGYVARTKSHGIEPTEISCARRIYVGEAGHIGMPHVPSNDVTIQRVSRYLSNLAPDIELVDDVRKADWVLSIMTFSKAACTHCDVAPESEWMAFVERGGAEHQREYSSIAPFLELSGEVREGANPAKGFVRQFVSLVRSGQCSSAGN